MSGRHDVLQTVQMSPAESIEPELYERLSAVMKPGDVVLTLSHGKPNTIQQLTQEGVLLETDASVAKGIGSQLVPGWMFNVAWRELVSTGRLTARELVKLAHRSSAVCALLARLPEVEVVSSSPIELRLKPVPRNSGGHS